MSNPIEVDLSQVLGEINQKLGKIDERLNRLEVGQARLEEKVEGLSKRIDSQEFTNRGVLVGLLVIIFGGAAKLFGFLPNS